MRLMLPSPVLGWRAFWGEVGIIVLGVLIALGFQHLAEGWNWQRSTAQAEGDLKAESATNFELMAERTVVQPCIDAQLDRLMAHVLAGGAINVPVEPINQGFADFAFRQPVDRTFQDDVWQSLISDGTATHFDRAGRQRMAQFYSQLGSVRDLQRKGDVAVAKLNVLLSPVPLDPATRGALLVTIAEQKFTGKLLTLDAIQALAMLKSAGQAPDGAKIDVFLDTSKTKGICRARGLPLDDWRKKMAEEFSTGRYDVRRLVP